MNREAISSPAVRGWTPAVLQALFLHLAVLALAALGISAWHRVKPVAQTQTLAIEATVVPAQPRPQPQQPQPQPQPPQPAPPPTPQPEAPAPQPARIKPKPAPAQAPLPPVEQKSEIKSVQRPAPTPVAHAKPTPPKPATPPSPPPRPVVDRKQAEADLRSELAAEEHVDRTALSSARAEYQAMITARINQAWIRPASAHRGVNCIVHITQIPSGEVVGVKVESCNGDATLRQSVEMAAYRASPLPVPSQAAVFDAHITVHFAPDDE